MDGAWVRRFVREEWHMLENRLVRRIVPTAEGLLLALHGDQDEIELGMAALPGAAWAWTLPQTARAKLHAGIVELQPALVRAAPELGWRDPDATSLDALRAWLSRPGPGGGWSVLIGARLVRCEALGADRIVEFGFESHDALGDVATLVLRAELFDQGANALLLRPDGTVVARWRDRKPVAPRATPTPNHDDATAVDRDLATTAFLDLATAAAGILAGEFSRAGRREATRLARLVAHLETEMQDAAAASSWRQVGDLLAANQHRLKRGMDSITVEDFFADGEPRTIALDPQLSPQDNVAAYFKRARRGARGRATITSRLETSRARLETLVNRPTPAGASWSEALSAALEIWRSSVPRATTSTPLARLWAAGGPEWTAPRATPSQPSRPLGPGRRYVLPGGWEVRVGRDDADNDTLTHRFASPDDVWLHASGVAGSHVVLRMQGRAGNPPRAILEAAAALAARFSKAKHAGTVPVIWTRKRYVRKPRGGHPGLAACTQEKTIFVRPAVPDTIASEDED